MADKEYDVIVIGGGINGVGIARDCALRGIKALLVEKHDFAKGASGNNTGMIHGGIRYLKYDVGTTRLSCTDSGYIQKIAPHLLSRIPFLFPVLKNDLKGRLLLEGAEIFFEAYDTFQPLKRGKKHTRLTKQEVLQLEPGLSSNVIGAVTLDEWGINAYRLTVENAVDAFERGASVRTYCEVTDFLQDPGGVVVGVKLFDRRRDRHEKHFAPIVINATGAWGPLMSKKLKAPYQLRPGKGVHVVFSHRVSNYGLIMNAVDGRQMFFLPQETKTIVGTTDDDFYGNLDQPPVLADEVNYILEAARQVFPKVDLYRQISTYVGVRPTVYAWGKSEDALSREHVIIDHADSGNVGLFSVTGGKLASYRQLAEEVTDKIAKRLNNTKPCQTHVSPLPGGEDLNVVENRSRNFNVGSYSLAKSASKFGSRLEEIYRQYDLSFKSQEEVCSCEPISKGEIEYALEKELVERLSDLRGRLNLCKGLCAGSNCALRAAQIFTEEKDRDITTLLKELHHTMNETFEEQRLSLTGPNLASQEMSQMAYFMSGNFKAYFNAAKNVSKSNFVTD